MCTKMEQIEALTRALNATRCFKEDNVPSKIEEVLKFGFHCSLFFFLLIH